MKIAFCGTCTWQQSRQEKVPMHDSLQQNNNNVFTAGIPLIWPWFLARN